MSVKNPRYMARHERMQQILDVILDHTRQFYPSHAGITMYGIAREMGLKPSTNVMSMIKELQRDGLVDGFDVIHRAMPGGHDNVVKTYWYLPEYPPVEQQKMDGF